MYNLILLLEIYSFASSDLFVLCNYCITQREHLECFIDWIIDILSILRIWTQKQYNDFCNKGKIIFQIWAFYLYKSLLHVLISFSLTAQTYWSLFERLAFSKSVTCSWKCNIKQNKYFFCYSFKFDSFRNYHLENISVCLLL